MGIYYKTGDLLDAPVDYICHQVNCQGRMGSGIAKQIRDRWPVVYEQYIEAFNERTKKISDIFGKPTDPLSAGATLLGHLQQVSINDKQTVINMFSQQNYGYDGKKYTSYDAFWDCLQGIALTVPKGSKIGFPERIGCGLGGANWNIIRTMIEEVLAEDYEVYIYILQGAE